MRFFCLSLLLILFFNCSNSKKNRFDLIDYAPKNSKIVIHTSNLESLKSSLQNNSFLNSFSKTEEFNNYKSQLKSLSHLNTSNPVLICFSEKDNNSSQYTLITKYSDAIFKPDSLKNYTEETLKYKNKTLIKSTLEGLTFYSTMIDSLFILSSSKTIIDNTVNTTNTNKDLNKLFTAVSHNENIAILVNSNNSPLNSFFIEESLSNTNLSDFLALETEINQDEIYSNGITKSLDSSNKAIDIFKNTIPQENHLQDITPSNSDGFMSFTFDDFEVLNTNLAKHQEKDSITKNTTLFDNCIEAGVIYQGNKQAIVLNSIDVIATAEALISEKNNLDTYRGVSLFNFSQPKLFSKTFHPLISYTKANIYCVIDNFFIFSDSIELLQNIIANYQNKTTLNHLDFYKNISEKLSNESSLMLVVKPELLKSIAHKNLNKDYNLNLNTFNLSAIQFIYDTSFAHVHSIIKKGKKRGTQNSITEELNIKLDNPILTSPQFVTNHITKQKEIVVQDISNNLYLISNRGKILWKKRLNGSILGKVEQIDIYKNGRLQLAFATQNRVYVLDRKGKDVAPFPMKFNDAITQPLSVFDYDSNKKYRLLVTQGKHVLMYDTKAKIVKGFIFKSANETINSQPKHFRIGSKDYIVLKTQNKLHILNRTGKTRITPKTTNTYSEEPVFLYQNKFTTTTSDGHFISIDSRGNTAKVNLNLQPKHAIETTSKTRVSLNNNKLTIKNKTLELDFGNYTRPSIFYINDKIYVSVTDLQTNKILLFDSQAKLRPNFPIYGNSIIDMANIDRDKNLEFVTKGDNNSILLYQIN